MISAKLARCTGVLRSLWDRFLASIRSVKKRFAPLPTHSEGRFQQLEPRRVLNASFTLIAGDLTIDSFANGTNLDVSFNTGTFDFTLSTGNWTGSATGATVSAQTLSIDPLELTGAVNISSPFASNVNFVGDISSASSFGDFSLTTLGDVTDSAGTILNVTGSFNIAANSVSLGDAPTDSIQIGTLSFNTADSTTITTTSDVILNADSLATNASITTTGNLLLNADLDVSGDVVLSATAILDGDTSPDFSSLVDPDISGQNVTLTATTIGFSSGDFFKGDLNSLEVNAVNDLTVTADSAALEYTVGGTPSITVTNLALSHNGILNIDDIDGVAVAGDLRIEAGDIVTTDGTIDLQANRMLIVSGASETLSVSGNPGSLPLQLDARTAGDLVVVGLTDLDLIDLDCDNVALATTDAAFTGSITVSGQSLVTVSDDVIAGYERLVPLATSRAINTSTGNIAISSGSDLTIHDAVVSGAGNIVLQANNDVILTTASSINDNQTAPNNDDLPVVTSSVGNISITADQDADNFGAITMSDGTRVVAGRDTSTDYLPGMDGLASVSTISLSGVSQGAGAAEISLTAAEDITLGSLQTNNATENAIRVTSTLGGILDGGDSDSELIANFDGALTTLRSATGTGDANPLEVELYALDAVNSASGNIYLQEVASSASNLNVVNADNVNLGETHILALDGVLTVVGSTFSPNNGLFGVSSETGDILLEARGATGDVILDDNGGVTSSDGNVPAAGGDITLWAENSVTINDSVSTFGTGRIYVRSVVGGIVHGNSVDDSITAVDGDILLQAENTVAPFTGNTVTITGSIRNTGSEADIGVVAANDIIQNDDLLSTSDEINAGRNVLMTAGNDLTLGYVVATGTVALSAGNNIIDGNGSVTSLAPETGLNVSASSLSMRAGGMIGDADLLAAADTNENAIDTRVDTLAAMAGSGIYVQDVDDVTVGNVAAVSVTASRVNFNSTESDVTENLGELDDLTSGSVIKLVTTDGSITVTDGNDGDNLGVESTGAGDILLEARGATGDVILDDNGGVTSSDGNVPAAGGDITLWAERSVITNDNITAVGAGRIYVRAASDITHGNAASDSITSDTGDILLDAGNDITLTGSLDSVSGNIGVVAGNDIVNGVLTTGGSVLMSAGNDLTLDSVTATGTVALSAGNNIIDGNGTSLNVSAAALSMRAGGMIGDADLLAAADTNENAIDTRVDTLAAMAGSGIYVQEVDDVTVGNVAAVSVTASRVNFNSTESDVTENLGELDDLTSGSVIKLVTTDGSITVTDGSDGDNLGVESTGAGDILLEARGASGDVILDDNGGVTSSDGNVPAAGGDITLWAERSVTTNDNITAVGAGRIYVRAASDITHGNAASDSITSDTGDILLDAGNDITLTGSLDSASGNIGVVAGNDIVNGVLTTGGSVLMSAGNDLTLDSVTATGTVALSAGNNIIDGNGTSLNVSAAALSMRAGGMIGDADLLAAADTNENAIDTRVDTLAAMAGSGIYVQEVDDVTVGNVAAVSVTASRVNFNSTESDVTENLGELDDLTSGSVIKLVTTDGSITVTDGSDGDNLGVESTGAGDILLEARGASGDVILDDNGGVTSSDGNVPAAGGDITLWAERSVTTNDNITAVGAGRIYVRAASDITHGNAASDSITSDTGDILLDAGNDITLTGSLDSASGNIGVVAGNDIVNGVLTTGGSVLISAGNDLTLDSVTATGTVALSAGNNIIDGNGTSLNVSAATLSMRAGGMIGDADLLAAADTNENAIDTRVDTLAAMAGSGIYVQEVDDVTVGNVAAVSVTASRVNFNSTESDVTENLGELDDLTSGSVIKLVTTDGSITVTDGNDGDNLGVESTGAGDILLEARGATGDVILDDNGGVTSSDGNVPAAGGDITLWAENSVTINDSVSTFGTGRIYVRSVVGGIVHGNSVDDSITAVDGDILLQAENTVAPFTGNTVTITGSIRNTGSEADIGVVAANDIIQNDDLLSTSDEINAGRNVLMTAGNDLTLGYVVATGTVALSAGNNIIDGNGSVTSLAPETGLNVSASSLSMRAGGMIGDADLLAAADTNENAIDTRVDTLAAMAGSGIYVQEVDDVTVGNVAAVSVTASRVNFNSTESDVTENLGELDDLTSGSVIKLVTADGSITVTDGNDGDNLGVESTGAGDILLEARGATGDVILDDNGGVTSSDGNVPAAGGDITLWAENSVTINDSVSTFGTGRIYVRSVVGGIVHGNSVDDSITAVDGDILLQAENTAAPFTGNTVTITGSIRNTGSEADIGVVAANDIIQNDDLLSTSDEINAGRNVLMTAGNDLTLGYVVATGTVALSAGNNIIDGNGSVTSLAPETGLNVSASSLSMRAGGMIGAPAGAAIDTRAANLGATALSGIYIAEVGSVAISEVASVEVEVDSVNFNSTQTTRTQTLVSIDDVNSSGDVVLSATAILDGDTSPDFSSLVDPDISGQNVTLTATTIGFSSGDFFKGDLNSLEVNAVNDLTVTADSAALEYTVGGTPSITVTNLALSHNGILNIDDIDGVAVAGDLRIEAGDIVTTDGTIDLQANRMLIVSGASETLSVSGNPGSLPLQLDARTAGDLVVVGLTDLDLIDLDCDNVALATTDAAFTGSITVSGQSLVTVSDDVIAGYERLVPLATSRAINTSTGNIAISSGSDLTIHDAVVSGAGNIVLQANNDVILTTASSINDNQTAPNNDDLPVVTSSVGNISITADQDADNFGAITMSDGTRVVAGRDTSTDYLPGIDGLASVSTVSLSGVSQGAGAAEISLTAAEDITLGSLQTNNATENAMRVTSTLGGILDGGDSDSELIANFDDAVFEGALTTLRSATGTGDANPLEVELYALDTVNSASGNIHLQEVASSASNLNVVNADNVNLGDIHILALDGVLTVVGSTFIPNNGLFGVDTETGDILLEARGASGDVILADDGGVSSSDGNVPAAGGDITLWAENSVTINDSVSTFGTGSIYVRSVVGGIVHGNSVTDSITAVAGDILLQAENTVAPFTGNTVTITGSISNTGSEADIGVVAANDIVQNDDLLSTSDEINAGRNVLMTAGNDLTLGYVVATGTVVLSAGNNIIDGNGSVTSLAPETGLNVSAVALSMRAGGMIGDSDLLAAANTNQNAIDTQVGTLAALAGSGIYVQEVDDVTVGNVAAVSVTVSRVNFNSTETDVTENLGELDDLTSGSVIKLVTTDGSITVTDGSDGDNLGVESTGAGDILLEARGANGDVILANDGGVQSSDGNVPAAGGDITLWAEDSVMINDSVTTFGAGRIYVRSVVGDINLSGSIDSVAGDILLHAETTAVPFTGGNITLAGTVSSATGNIGVVAGSNIVNGVLSAGGNVLMRAGNDITLDLVTATNTVAMSAGNDIVDGNNTSLNVSAAALSMRAGGMIGDSDLLAAANTNQNAIDTRVGTLAAMAGSGIYVQEVDDVTVGNVAGVSVTVSRVNFNSTESDVTENLGELDDLTSGSVIKLVTTDGSITVTDGNDGDDLGVESTGAGDILLEARGASGDVILANDGGVQSSDGNVPAAGGDITLWAENSVMINDSVTTFGAGRIYVRSVVGDINLSGSIDTVAGDILLHAETTAVPFTGGNITLAGTVSSATGNIGVVAGSNIVNGVLSAGGNVLMRAGNDITLDLVTATNTVAMSAGNDIVDGNNTSLNVSAAALSMRAGGMIGDADLLAAANTNQNAIDTRVGTLAAMADSGIYIQEVDDVTVGNVAGVSVTVSRVNFNSTESDVTENLGELDDLTSGSVIKLVTTDGSITVTDGSDGDNLGVESTGAGDILLEARGANGDVILANDGGVGSSDGNVPAAGGDITLWAENSVMINDSVTTFGAGRIYVRSVVGDINLSGSIDTVAGDILLQAENTVAPFTGNTVTITGSISNTGSEADIGVVAANDIVQNDDLLSTSDEINAGRSVLMTAGNDLTLGYVVATGTVALSAGNNIIDGNGSVTSLAPETGLNVSAVALSMRAGGMIGDSDLLAAANTNENAIDTRVGTLAALAGSGIYVQEVDDVTVGNVAGVSVTVSRVNFNSTESDVTENLGELDDLTSGSVIKLVTTDGSITVTDGNDGDDLGVESTGAGDILLEARGASGDVILADDGGVSSSDGNVPAAGGDITLWAENSVTINDSVSTFGTGRIYVRSVVGGIVHGNSVTDSITAVAGDILLQAENTVAPFTGNTVTITGSISNTGSEADIGVVAANDIVQNDDLLSTSDEINAGRNVLMTAGNDLTLGYVVATGTVVLSAGNNIIDGNGSVTSLAPETGLNVSAVALSMRAGGMIGAADLLAAANTNQNAIDTRVGTLAAMADSGIYIQEVDDVTVGNVAGVSVTVSRVNFNSTESDVTENLGELDDLTSGSVIKLVTTDGSITVTDGSDGDNLGVESTGPGDILLEARGASGDVILANDGGVQSSDGNVPAAGGDITLWAENSVMINDSVTTFGAGRIYVRSVVGDINLSGSIDSVAGDILLHAETTAVPFTGGNITLAGTVSSATGNIGVVAGSNIVNGVLSAGGNVLMRAGNDITLDLVTATNTVAMSAGNDIVDGNNTSLNVSAAALSMRAGGMIGDADLLAAANTNQNAIDTRVGTLAAMADSGIYIQEVDDVTVGNVAGVSVTVSRVNFNSTESDVTENLGELDDLTSGSVIKLVTTDGSITVTDGNDGDDLGVESTGAGDILLEARGASGDVILANDGGVQSSDGNVPAAGGDITLWAENSVMINDSVTTFGAGRIYVRSVVGDINLSGSIDTVAGDILLHAETTAVPFTGGNITLAGTVSSATGNIGVVAGSNIVNGVLSAGGNVLMRAGNDITLDLVTATNTVAMSAGNDIVDGNNTSLNVSAAALSMRAGGMIGDADLLAAANTNQNAIDTRVGTLAAMADSGIYIQEVDDVTVGNVAGVSVTVSRVNFNSTESDVTENLGELDDLTSGSVIKLVTTDGSITVTDGSDGDNLGVESTGAGDILLEARGANGDVILANDGGVGSSDGNVPAAGGDITLWAEDSVMINDSVTTFGAGRIYVRSVVGDINLSGSIDSVAGDILLHAETTAVPFTGGNITLAGTVSSATGNIGVVAGSNIVNGVLSAGGNVLMRAGNDITLDLVTATNTVAMSAGNDIVDGNNTSLNVSAAALSMRAGGMIGDSDLLAAANTNQNAIDTRVGTLAAMAGSGIYVQEVDDVTVGNVAGVSVTVSRVNFNSTESDVTENLGELDDLTSGSVIKLVTTDGSITVTDGNDGDDLGVESTGAGDILLEARGASGDVILADDGGVSSSDGNVPAAGGDITLWAENSVTINDSVSTFGTGRIYVRSVVGGIVHGNSVTDSITAVAGDILLQAENTVAPFTGNTVTITGSISNTGSEADIGVVAANDIVQNDDLLSTSDEINAGRNVLMTAGNDLTLGYVVATGTVALSAGNNIIDGNGSSLNVSAAALSMRAGGMIGDSDLLAAANTNQNAIDTRVDTLAAMAGSGIYVQEVDDVTVGNVAAVSVTASRVNFNSTESDVTENLGELDDLTSGSVIKLVTTDGSITVTDGSDGDNLGVESTGAGDILLEARGASGDVILDDNGGVTSSDGNVPAAGGDITLWAERSVITNDNITAVGAGRIYVRAASDITHGNAASDSITSDTGDILLDAGNDITLTGSLDSVSGNIGVVAGNDIVNGVLTTGGSVLMSAGNDLTLDSVTATGTVALSAGNNIIDGNGSSLNVSAAALSMRAGGMIGDADLLAAANTNQNAIDTRVDTLAAMAGSGIYVQEVDDVTVGNVAAVSVTASRVNFNSTESDVTENLGELDDLTSGSVIKLVTTDGSITVIDGSDGDNLGVESTGAGDILLEARGKSADVILATSGGMTNKNGKIEIVANNNMETNPSNNILLNAAVSANQAITMNAYNDIFLNAAVSADQTITMSAATGSIDETDDAVVTSDSLVLNAGQHVHLHDINVATVRVQAGSNAQLNASGSTEQVVNLAADAEGRSFLDQLAEGLESEFRTEVEGIAEALDAEFRFNERFNGAGYAIFLKNTGNLVVEDSNAGLLAESASPNVYIETISGDLDVIGTLQTISNDEHEGGIVLVAGEMLKIDGDLRTTVSSGVEQLVGSVSQESNPESNPALPYTQIDAVFGEFYDGGEGGELNQISTEFVIPDALILEAPLSSPGETPNTHVLQRVALQFAEQSTDSGFLTIIAYADARVEAFIGENSAGFQTGQILSENAALNTDRIHKSTPGPIEAAPRTTADFAVLQRGDAFTANFLNQFANLTTNAVIRRPGDFFLFSDADTSVQDLAVETSDIQNVNSRGQGFVGVLPEFESPERIYVAPTPPPEAPQLLNTVTFATIELPIQVQKQGETAIYKVDYDDLNLNGQVDANEIPSFAEIIRMEVIGSEDEENPDEKEMKKVKEVKPKSGDTPTQEDLTRAKNELLTTPDQPSGAYAIIQEDASGQKTVLDAFAIRDWPEEAKESDGDTTADEEKLEELLEWLKMNKPTDAEGGDKGEDLGDNSAQGANSFLEEDPTELHDTERSVGRVQPEPDLRLQRESTEKAAAAGLFGILLMRSNSSKSIREGILDGDSDPSKPASKKLGSRGRKLRRMARRTISQ